MAVRTWAPRGQTPVLSVPLTRDHLSAISAITLDGRLFMQVRQASYDSIAVVGFLRVLLRKVSGKILLIWDGSPIHRGHAIKAFLKRGAAKRLHLEQLAFLCSRSQPRRGHLELPQARGVRQCLLSRLENLTGRTDSGKGALAAQASDHHSVCSSARVWPFMTGKEERYAVAGEYSSTSHCDSE